MSKYYYFEAKGTGTDPNMGGKRDLWEGGFDMGLGGVLLESFVKIVNKDGVKIRRAERNPRFFKSEDLTVVKPKEWDCPDLGKMKPKCLATNVGMMEYVTKMKPGIEKWFVEVGKPDGNPVMIIGSGSEALGAFGCLYEIKEGKMNFKVEKPKKEKKRSLFGW